MNDSLADQLKNIKLDHRAYGTLPVRGDLFIISKEQENKDDAKALQKNWQLLNYLRKQLMILDKYIQDGGQDTLGDWLSENSEGLSDHAYKTLATHDNQTGGISAYFLNLQKKYDTEEAAYDNLERKAAMPGYLKEEIKAFRDERAEKRKIRAKIQKMRFKGMKKDSKGYLFYSLEDPPQALETTENAEGDEEKKEESDEKKEGGSEEKNELAMEEVGDRIGIAIAGFTIFIGAVGVAWAVSGKGK
ncbi:MAG: hypothetical protein COA79_20360 [Planctomycetota bacterium]|nr:MAG: hypothetical protein COA79_20360 [Planctomycetota bacterium]